MSKSMSIPATPGMNWGGLGYAVKLGQERRGPIRAQGDVQPASAKRLLSEGRAKSTTFYRLWDGEGTYLRLDGLGTTTNHHHAWVGSASYLPVALERFEAARGMRPLAILKLPPVAIN